MSLNAIGGVSPQRPRTPSAPGTERREAPVQQDPQDMVFSFNPQDRRTLAPGKELIPQVITGARGGPETDLATLNEPLEPENGCYVYPNGDPRQNTAIAFAATAKTINVFREVFGDFKWAFKYDKLAIHANAGKDLNAYYSRPQGTVNFFQDDDPIFGQPVHSGASGEIVAHEVGHALLDAVRPEYLGAWRADVGAFHESFADIMAMHVSLMDERVVKRVVVQTGGDLSKPNISAHMAEELGEAMNNRQGRDSTGGDYLRNANNTFTWAEPKSLPKAGGPQELGWGKHSFGRLWTGAHFDLLKAMVNERMQAGEAPDVAIRESNQELLKMTVQMLRESPRGDFTYQDMAIAFVKSDNIHNEGKRAALIQDVFTQRKILPQDLDPAVFEPTRSGANLLQGAEEPPVSQVGLQLGDDFGMFSGARVEVPVSADRALFHSQEVRSQTRDDIRRLIDSGQIRYNDPNYQMQVPQDYFNPQGEVYTGIVVWEDGQMKIERLPVAD